MVRLGAYTVCGVLRVVKVMVDAWLEACLPMTQPWNSRAACAGQVQCGRLGQIKNQPHHHLHASLQVRFGGPMTAISR
ncbi:hypothetical protein HBI56_074490 [Parastagonospora nodorum]|uniref:Uncharacterized protein n=1 Tax=Phaeosphaeria nodorum (strain SN15 / ATCC MYA-4574 / FGSC 10173) TaxID=321614 RepID=A0A7U2HWG7_PHANO|nr:hypothetical protein HBH56_170490 [Parastagonospora nodorum]QRC94455.1 hypothetical protein JI435_405840 [Parastagonospora nodorum SN15]KAH3928531.1 hypothetical protein HBH54_139050 [Parastagonospora nodorum]KAH3984030.1 hypothetical protein HBH52_059820 [Parastagonospora nodorum]KAH3985557.1 hypothetical protein HBH51_018660 [Parastagonospora nodorum]